MERMELPELVRPRLRGVSHQYAFFVSVALGAVLVASAPPGWATAACAVYAVAVCGLFGTSALYHRLTWTPRGRRRMRRLDHSMIFVLIAGTYTPVAVLALSGTMQVVMLSVAWGGALAGVVLKVVWVDAPKWLGAAIYVALGWVSLPALGQLSTAVGTLAVVGFGVGGVLYTAGAVIYALGKPNPWPGIFGFHEVFHALVIAAAALHYAVIALLVVPRG